MAWIKFCARPTSSANPPVPVADRLVVQRLPELHRLISLCDRDGLTHQSRIEGIEGDWLVVARPLDLYLEHGFDLAGPLEVCWAEPDGLIEVTATLVETRAQGPVGLWVVQPTGPYRRVQRRHYARVRLTGPVAVTPLPSADDCIAPAEAVSPDGCSATGRLVDLSEAALRCTMPAETALLLPAGGMVVAAFELGGVRFELAAVTGPSTANRQQPQQIDLVLRFEVGEDRASLLRRAVFDEQIRQRNLARKY